MRRLFHISIIPCVDFVARADGNGCRFWLERKKLGVNFCSICVITCFITSPNMNVNGLYTLFCMHYKLLSARCNMVVPIEHIGKCTSVRALHVFAMFTTCGGASYKNIPIIRFVLDACYMLSHLL